MALNFRPAGVVAALALALSGCANGGGIGSLGSRLFGADRSQQIEESYEIPENATAGTPPPALTPSQPRAPRRGLFGRNRAEAAATIQVNRYLWAAALDVLAFLPLRSADPFSGVIVTGYGTPPGGGRAYRATILIQDPALDARALNVSLMTRAGPASADTIRAVEDAILARARQLRQRDGRL